MKKRIVLLVLMLALLATAIAFTAQAATVPTDVEWIELGSKEDFLEWFGGGTAGKNLKNGYTAGMTRYYKLTADITIDEDSTVYYLSSSTYEVNTYLNLGGYTLTYASPKETGATRLFGSYNEKTTHTFVNGKIVNESAITGSNGGLFFMNKGKLVLEDLVIDDSEGSAYSASGGGKIVSAVGYDVTLTNVKITIKSTAKCSYGLAIRCQDANLTMTDCEFICNSTDRAAYGGLVSHVNGTATITGCTFTGGFAKHGGNLYLKGSNATVKDCTFKNGRSVSGGQGADLYMLEGSVTISGCTFENSGSTTPDFGGSIFSESTAVTMENCNITGGKAKYGGAVYKVNNTMTITNTDISGGYATVAGGNLLAKNGTTTFVSGTISGGKADVSGGNVSVANSGVMNFQGGTISGGKAPNGGNVGSDIGSKTGCTMNFKGTTIIDGKATTNGGNIYAAVNAGYAGYPTVNISAGTISGGTATASGGNVYVAGMDKEEAAEGKAAIAKRTAVLKITGGTITEGAAKDGGNVYMNFATITISGGQFTNGSAEQNAGNIYCSTATTTTLSGGTISGGVATNRGGNFYMSSTNTNLTITGGTISTGHSYAEGGNIYHGNGKLTITGGVVENGLSETSGGNIFASMGYGNSASASGCLTIQDDGNAATALPQIVNGTARTGSGGNLYVYALGNQLDTGANKFVMGNFLMSGGNARQGGEDLYISATTDWEILAEFAQDMNVFIEDAMLPAAGAASVLNTDRVIAGAFTGKLTLENNNNPFLFNDGTDTYAHVSAAAVIADGVFTWFKTNDEAVAQATAQSILRAGSGTMTLAGGEYLVDIAGQTVAITGTGKLTCFDSSNDTFQTYGTATVDGPELQNSGLVTVNGKYYYALEEDGTYSFHRVELELVSASLRPSVAGIYYTGRWSCDATMAAHVDSFGVAASTNAVPGADFADKAVPDSYWSYFGKDAFQNGVSKTGVMITGILKDAADGATADRIALNARYAQIPVHSVAYIRIDGVNYVGGALSYSLYDILKAVSDNLESYAAHIDTLQSFMTRWSANGLSVAPFTELTFQLSEDVVRLNNAYAGTTAYYGELHDHAATGGTSDGKQTLETWKTGLEALQMDFATIVDHKQSSHMKLDAWDNSIFIGGSEAACTITDRTGVKLHYNMIFADPAGLEAVVSQFPEFKWQYYPEDYTGENAAKLAGGWHFSYPSFTAERFTEVCQAVYANGGCVAIVHPKSVGYISSTDPADAYFMDGIAMEVFYTYGSSRDGWKVAENYKLWRSMIDNGYKVYVTAGNDEHDMPSDKAVSVIRSTERSAEAWVNQLRAGNFVAGGVDIRMVVGDTPMGGTTAFAGKRLSFSVGGFHKSLYNPDHVYRVDVYAGTEVVYTQEITCTETFYYAMDADAEADFYRIEIHDVTAESMLALSNPIWNED